MKLLQVMCLMSLSVMALNSAHGRGVNIKNQVTENTDNISANSSNIEINSSRLDAIESQATLEGLSCATDQIARFNGSQWICDYDSSGSPAIYEVTRQVTIISFPDVQATGTHDVFCEPGDRVISGGYSIPVGINSWSVPTSHAKTVIDSLGRERSVWRLGISANAGVPQQNADVFAYCLDLTP